MSDYPEHEKLKAVRNQSQTVGEFLEWLEERDPPLFLAHYIERSEYPVVALQKPNDLLAEFFDIDQDKLEAEKRAMLDAQRELNNG